MDYKGYTTFNTEKKTVFRTSNSEHRTEQGECYERKDKQYESNAT